VPLENQQNYWVLTLGSFANAYNGSFAMRAVVLNLLGFMPILIFAAYISLIHFGYR
jgi:hypothetical protein